ncbi:MAG: hypothetical protein ACTSR8_00795 [Promethearchaeota archaeon]
MTETLNLKSFPLIKVVSASLFIIGAILTYILSGSPKTMLFQFGGIPFNLIAGIFPLLCGIVLLIYAFITTYDVNISNEKDQIKLNSKKNSITLNKEEIIAVRVRDAGKFAVWFVFVFVNFFFVYYGIECVLYFSANHNAGLLKYSFYSLLIVWMGGLMLVLFPRKILIILTKEKAILQKVNYLPKDGLFEKIFDDLFGFDNSAETKKVKTNFMFLRLIIGITAISIFIITSILVEIDGIIQPLHDLGVFIPIFLLLFAVLMISITIHEPRTQLIKSKENRIRIKEYTLITPISGSNYLWLKSRENFQPNKLNLKEFRKLKIYGYLLIFVMFGQATFLAFKILWLPFIYLDYFDWIDFLIGIIILILIFLFSFDVRQKLDVKLDSEFNFVREIILIEDSRESNRLVGFKEKIKYYFTEIRVAMKNDQNNHLLKIIITCISALVFLTFIYVVLGFVFFLFI